jgi:hypothetical protein
MQKWGNQTEFPRKTLPQAGATIQSERQAEVAQLVEQLIRNQQVVRSIRIFGSIDSAKGHLRRWPFCVNNGLHRIIR